MTRTMHLAVALVALSGCDADASAAKEIVRRKLGNPEYIEFRRMRTNDEKHAVCGEVDASDMPGAGWRYFVAYPSVNDAAIAPPGEMTAAAEMGDPRLSGAAEGFVHMCD